MTVLAPPSQADTDVLAIVGSASFANPSALGHVAALIETALTLQQPDRIVLASVRGQLRGVAELAQQAAAVRAIPTVVFDAGRAMWAGPLGKQTREHRIAEACTRALVIRCATADARTSAYLHWLVTRARGAHAGELVTIPAVSPAGVPARA